MNWLARWGRVSRSSIRLSDGGGLVMFGLSDGRVRRSLIVLSDGRVGRLSIGLFDGRVGSSSIGMFDGRVGRS